MEPADADGKAGKKVDGPPPGWLGPGTGGPPKRSSRSPAFVSDQPDGLPATRDMCADAATVGLRWV